MKTMTRRMALGSAAGMTIGMGLAPASVLAKSPLKLPDGPLRLSRRMQRSLHDGCSITVERAWQLTFTPQGRGISVAGEQIDCRVEAPAALAPLMEIEQSRSTEDMWPVLLNGSGLILAAGPGAREEDVAHALQTARQMIGNGRAPQSVMEAQMSYLAGLQRAGASFLDRVPDDLFFPTGSPKRVIRSIDLPDGSLGEFELVYKATPASDGRWLDRAERTVVTRLAGTLRTAREEWQLRGL